MHILSLQMRFLLEVISPLCCVKELLVPSAYSVDLNYDGPQI